MAASLHNEFAQQLTPWLDLVLHVNGIKKDRAPCHSQLPITLEIMVKIKHALLRSPSEYNNIMLWAACCFIFRVSLVREFTVPSQAAYDPEVHLPLSDVATDDRLSPSVVQLTIKQSKTDPSQQGVQLYLGQTEGEVCPVRGVLLS